MISGIPRPALILGLSGTLPFIFGALACISPVLVAQVTGTSIFVASLLGRIVLGAYGIVILGFMSGVLWGFATKAADDQAGRFYVLSVIPAIMLFFYATYSFVSPLVGAGQPSLIPLILGFIALLGLDFMFWTAQLAPSWWMKLRSGITAIVVLCLGVGVITT